MTLFHAIFPTLLLLFGASFLTNIAFDLLSDVSSGSSDVSRVEVVNVGDFDYTGRH